MMKLSVASLIITLSLLCPPGFAQDPLDIKNSDLEQAIFAGGCFWCMESDFEKTPGVLDVVSGYIGGTGENPNYHDYVKKGHIEAVKITFDPSLITYQKMLDLFWRRIDPTDGSGQFCDRGYAYTTAIFYLNDEQKSKAAASKFTLDQSRQLDKPVATQVIKAGVFYPAEEYHQDYYKKNSLQYKFYRYRCGRDQRVKEIWGTLGHITEH